MQSKTMTATSDEHAQLIPFFIVRYLHMKTDNRNQADESYRCVLAITKHTIKCSTTVSKSITYFSMRTR